MLGLGLISNTRACSLTWHAHPCTHAHTQTHTQMLLPRSLSYTHTHTHKHTHTHTHAHTHAHTHTHTRARARPTWSLPVFEVHLPSSLRYPWKTNIYSTAFRSSPLL